MDESLLRAHPLDGIGDVWKSSDLLMMLRTAVVFFVFFALRPENVSRDDRARRSLKYWGSYSPISSLAGDEFFVFEYFFVF